MSALGCGTALASLVSSRCQCWRDLAREIVSDTPFPRRRARGSPLGARGTRCWGLLGVPRVGTSPPGKASAWPVNCFPELLTVCFSFAIGFRGSGANKVRAVLILKADVCFF